MDAISNTKDYIETGTNSWNGFGCLDQGGFPHYRRAVCNQSIRDKSLLPQAGANASEIDGATFAKVGWSGEVGVEISSAIKYALLERPSPGHIKPTELARKIVRPQDPKDKLDALRQAALNAPVVSEVYTKYRSENLPDIEFVINTLVDSFHVPREQVDESSECSWLPSRMRSFLKNSAVVSFES